MIETRVHKAQLVQSNALHVGSATLCIDQLLPPSDGQDSNTTRFQKDAEKIVRLLVSHLPGGTLDRVLIELLKHQVSVSHVSYGSEEA